ncbi:MAG: hypothetical protein HY420_04695 [Candidatus Kerfeldbacteria bacterium]|nr:hypothetical protein [Candidatus Kerfeldbacteria bacterium]
MLRHVGRLEAFASTISGVDVGNLTWDELKKCVLMYFSLSLNAHSFLAPTPTAGTVLEEMIQRQLPTGTSPDRKRWTHDLVYPAKYNAHVMEERAFLRMVMALKRNSRSQHEAVNQHLRRFDWIGARWFQWQNAWTEPDLNHRLRTWKRKSMSTVRIAYADNIAAWKHLKQNARALARRLNIGERSRVGKTIELAREFAYLRAWRTDVIYKASYQARLIFLEVARRYRLPENLIRWLTYKELLELVESDRCPISIKKLRERKRFHATLLSGDAYRVLTGSQWLRSYVARLTKRVDETAVRGTSAYPGTIQGRVRVLRSSSELHLVKRGDILVTVMTFPHFIAAMERAAAFVTDEGGILCHAAIVRTVHDLRRVRHGDILVAVTTNPDYVPAMRKSKAIVTDEGGITSHAAIVARELNIPCVVGTKTATSVLKNGDWVEVDANKGTIRKL